jgi:N-acetyl-anhydromuramoyl-L-alanine amidase
MRKRTPDDRLELAPDGVLQGALFLASPNCDQRPEDARIELIVVHNISLPPGEFGGPGVAELFSNRLDASAHPYYAGIAHLRVSAHFFIRRSGQIMQFVPCSLRAWHAGESAWRGRARCNDFSIGIELEGADDAPFTDAQYASLQQLTQALRVRYPDLKAIAGHQDIAPQRKTDPGPHFDWNRYQLALGPDLAWRA